MWFDTKKILLTSGVASAPHALNAFDNALRNAGIADFNLIKVSSIVPKGVPVEVMDVRPQLIEGHGLLVPSIYEAPVCSGDSTSVLSAAVGVGIPHDRGAGVIFVASGQKPRLEIEDTLKEMIDEGMARLRNIRNYEVLIESTETRLGVIPTCALAAAVFVDSTLLDILNRS